MFWGRGIYKGAISGNVRCLMVRLETRRPDLASLSEVADEYINKTTKGRASPMEKKLGPAARADVYLNEMLGKQWSSRDFTATEEAQWLDIKEILKDPANRLYYFDEDKEADVWKAAGYKAERVPGMGDPNMPCMTTRVEIDESMF